MSKFLLEYDDNEIAISATLVLDERSKSEALLSKLVQYETEKYIDLRQLQVIDVWTVIHDMTKFTNVKVIVDDVQLNEPLLKTAKNISDIDYSDDAYILTIGENSELVLSKYHRLNTNIQQKSKSYELQIVESLLSEQGKNNEKIAQLQRETKLLKQSSGNVNDDELETRYLDLMEKYKQALKRLEQLRESKLGKLQVAYWNKKRGY